MTNADKYLKDGVDVEKLAGEFYNYTCTDKVDKDMGVRLVDFFSQDVKPTLTEDERVILRNIEICNYIGRNDNGELYMWKYEDGILPIFIDDLYGSKFQFIQPRRRI